MSYLVLARKYRPQAFSDVIGQEHITQTLANAIAAGRLSHAILLSGPRGTGKTTMARLLAKSMNCEQGPTATPCNQCENCKAITAGHSADVLEIDGASNNGVDQVRELRENSKYMPSQSRYKIYIIDEVHMLSLAAFNALLKTLEEPPAHVLFFFATTERHKLPVTILSRCQRYDFRRVQLPQVSAHLGKLCANEGVEIDPACLDMIAGESGGSVRDAISLLDQVISTATGPVTMAHAQMALGITERQNILDLAQALLTRNAAKMLDLVGEVYDSGYDLKKLHQDLLEHFRDLLLVKLNQNAALLSGEADALREQAALADTAALNYYLDALFRAESTIKYAGNSRLALETVLLRIMAAPPALSIDTLIEKLDNLCQKGLGAGTAVATISATEKKTPESAINREAAAPLAAIATPAESKPAVSPVVAAATAPPTTSDNLMTALLEYLNNKYVLTANALADARIIAFNDDKVELGVKCNRITLSRLQSDKYIQAIQEAFMAVAGIKPAVTYTCETEPVSYQAEQKERREKTQALLKHPVITDAMEIFRGEVVNVKEIKSKI